MTVRRHLLTSLWVLLGVGVMALRFYECTQLPAHTGDISRHIYYALLVAQQGLSAAGQSLVEHSPAYRAIAWSDIPYNYPVVTLFFFTAATWISPTLFFVRFSLTVVEALNALLVGIITRERWLALLYWAAPNSIWWISREGQFEALQNVFVFATFFLLKRFPRLACVALALAIQVKLSAVLLLPLVAWHVWTSRPVEAWKPALAFVAGFAPTALAMMYYPAVQQMAGSAPLFFNPYYWNPFARDLFHWLPTWMIWSNELASYGMIALLTFGLVAFRRRQLPYLAPLLFLLASKAHKNVEFWYMCLIPSFVTPIPEVRLRRLLFLLYPLLDVFAATMVVSNRALYLPVGSYFGPIDAFTPIHLL